MNLCLACSKPLTLILSSLTMQPEAGQKVGCKIMIMRCTNCGVEHRIIIQLNLERKGEGGLPPVKNRL